MYRLIGSVHTLSGLPGAIADFLRAMDSVRKAIAVESGLSAGELRVMSRIAEADGVTPKSVAVDLELSTGNITAITNGLVARGLIIRAEHPEDRRSLLLTLTPDGHAVMQSVYKHFQAELAHAISTMDKADEAVLLTILTHFTTTLTTAP